MKKLDLSGRGEKKPAERGQSPSIHPWLLLAVAGSQQDYWRAPDLIAQDELQQKAETLILG